MCLSGPVGVKRRRPEVALSDRLANNVLVMTVLMVLFGVVLIGRGCKRYSRAGALTAPRRALLCFALHVPA